MTPQKPGSALLATLGIRVHADWSVWHIVRFGMVGLLATGLHYTVALIGLKWIGLSPVAANATGFLTALTLSFVGHSLFTFRVQATTVAAIRFMIVNLTTIGFGSALVTGLDDYTGLGDAEVLAIGALFSAGSNFLGHSLWSFSETRT